MLAWARERWACIVFNLHVDHTPEGIAKAAGDFRRLIDRAIQFGGSYYLTYHRWATARQLLACHPRISEFLQEKRQFDPRGGVPQRLVHPSRTPAREHIMKTSIVVAARHRVLSAATAASASPREKRRRTCRPSTSCVLNDGSRAYGQVEKETRHGDRVSHDLRRRRSRAAKARIVSMRPVLGRMVRGEFRREDPNSTRLAFGPTARAVPRGEAYLGVYQGLVPFVQVGVTDRFSIGGGTPLIFSFNDWDRPYWVTPKLQVYSGRRHHAAVGLFHGVRRRRERRRRLRRGHEGQPGRRVHARRRHRLQRLTARRGAVAMVGGEAPARRNIKWITENYVWKCTAVTSGGVRFFGERLAADLADRGRVHRRHCVRVSGRQFRLPVLRAAVRGPQSVAGQRLRSWPGLRMTRLISSGECSDSDLTSRPLRRDRGPRTRDTQSMSTSRVVVAGAGLAGLTAARYLERAGADVTIVEARDRVGGRVHTRAGLRGGAARRSRRRPDRGRTDARA